MVTSFDEISKFRKLVLISLNFAGVRDMSHVSLSGHDLEQGDQTLLPPVHDLPLSLLRPDHQDRVPGRHGQEVGQQGKAVEVKIKVMTKVMVNPIASIFDSQFFVCFATTNSDIYVWQGE